MNRTVLRVKLDNPTNIQVKLNTELHVYMYTNTCVHYVQNCLRVSSCSRSEEKAGRGEEVG